VVPYSTENLGEGTLDGVLLFYLVLTCDDIIIYSSELTLDRLISTCPINSGRAAGMIPVVHGTSELRAWDICQFGFANVSTLEEGSYGKGKQNFNL
jgi:hypothetical protein